MARRLGCAVCSVTLLAAAMAGCGQGGPGASGLDLPEGAALIPPDAIDGRPLRTLDLDLQPSMHGLSNADVLIVTRVDDVIVAVAETLPQHVEERIGDLEDHGAPGPRVEGVQTRLIEGYGLLGGRSLLMTVDGSIVQIASRTLSAEALADLSSEVRTPIDAEGAIPGEQVGALRASTAVPVATASYEVPDGGRDPVSVFTATPAEQAAYLAIAHTDPGRSIDEQTEASCCAHEILRRARTVTVHGVESTITTLTTSTKLLVVPGDPGIVAISRGSRSWDEQIPTDAEMVAIAEGSVPATPDELRAHVRARDDAALERQLGEIRADEANLGWQVLTDLIIEEIPIVLAVGSSPRPGIEPPPTTTTSVCAVHLTEDVGAEHPLAACLPSSAPREAMVLATEAVAIAGGPLHVGAVRGDVARVALEFPEGEIEARMLEVPEHAGMGLERIFLLVGGVSREMELTGELSTGMAEVAFVAYDAADNELARIPRFPHLQQ